MRSLIIGRTSSLRKGCTEDTRINRIKQVVVFAVFLSAAFYGAQVARAAQAVVDSVGTASISIIPLDLKPRGIVLRGQTVDALIEEDAAGSIWADTEVWLKLHNGGKAPVVIPLALPGPQWSSFTLPEELAVTVGGAPLSLQPAPPVQGQTPITLTTPITLPVKGDIELRVRFRQALPTRSGLADYAYILTATRVWGGAPESLRVTARFKTPPGADQVLTQFPPVTSVAADGFTWQWTGTRAPSNTALAFLTPARWRQLTAARTAAAAPDARLAAHVALADEYRALAELTPPVYEQPDAYRTRFWPMMVAELRAGLAAAGDAPAPELANVRGRLAHLYRQQAERAPADAAAYLQLAASELREAVALAPEDALIRSDALVLFEQLAQAAEARGDTLTAQAHRANLAALRGEQGIASTEALSQAETLTLAEQALTAGNLARARQLVEQAFGPEILLAPQARAPRVDQVLAQVATTVISRTVALRMVDRAQGADATALALEAARAWQGLAPVTASEGGLTVTLVYSDTRQLNELQARLAAALPPAPELALLRAALSPAAVDWRSRAERFNVIERYVEAVDLSTAGQAWETEAHKLEAAAQDPQRGSAVLDRIAAAAWRADATRWRRLAELSRATYHATLQERGRGPEWLAERVRQAYTERPLTRQWTVLPGGKREVSAEVASWRYDRLAAVLGGAVALVLLVTLLLWRALR